LLLELPPERRGEDIFQRGLSSNEVAVECWQQLRQKAVFKPNVIPKGCILAIPNLDSCDPSISRQQVSESRPVDTGQVPTEVVEANMLLDPICTC
jgi:hypothetical protein